jgi:hypothetical protein
MVGETIKVKYKQLEAIRSVITKLFNQPLPIDAQYWLKRNVISIETSTKPYEEERRKIITTRGLKDKDAKTYTINPQDEKFQELMEKEIDIIINKIEIKKLTTAQLNQAEMQQIEFMLCEDKLIKTSSILIQ